MKKHFGTQMLQLCLPLGLTCCLLPWTLHPGISFFSIEKQPKAEQFIEFIWSRDCVLLKKEIR